MKLTFFETSDIHGYISPTNYAGGEDLGIGAAKVAAKLKLLRSQAAGPVITIENGDFIQGSPLSYYVAKNQHWSADFIKVINTMSYDVQVLGNHEFNYGLDYLKKAIASYNAPVLAANILNQEGEPYFGKGYTIIEKEGIRVAVLGLVTQYIPYWEQPSVVEGMQFERAVTTAKKMIPELRKLADIVVVSYHGGFERDIEDGTPTEQLTGENEGYQLLHEVSGIDALFTGHQHREIAAVVNGIPVVQPGYRGSCIGEIELTIIEQDGKLVVSDAQARLHPVADVQADTQILSIVAALESELEEWLDQPLGKVEGNMEIEDPMRARLMEHPYIEFINRVQQSASGAEISGTALFNNEGKGFKDIITMRDIITNYIYPNTLAIVKVNGAELRAALEQTAGYLAVANGSIIFDPKYIQPKPQYYNYDMYEGINYTIDVSRPIGQRITRLLFQGKPIESNQIFDIVINQYRAVGGGNYSMFNAGKIVREIQIDMTELIADYLRLHPVIQAETNQNFQVIM
ncbi:bifunctional metallophosphatase/5'-nucleotidase [Enterococcus sp. BWM-S5]|uniref:Bifunctional metallophosphatase/5'-nucleotidase n=1 Tax=Enterococcus larvae TaxID=2794352 RepID=A0ABS4CPU4_9ENTE|nr:bifunctional UDP-sugar hydrolase/5'-nucleotidase [Enterococcus larvae]MBP1048297.1 bifunctional metallophosphatase/5'-nucleotidase [Enterococcus larvae]